jgi:hypothetical protein
VPRYRYIGPGPIEVISGGEVIRPLDEREFAEEPAWGPWELLDEPEAAPPDTAPPPVPAATAFLTNPATAEGM